jgi:hypothetical protein
MVQKVFNILIHPIFLYVIIASLECIPYYSDLDKVVLHEMPKVGDNFKVLNNGMVYYYSGKGKYTYSTGDCYFKLGNPSWATNYKDGGIKTIDKSIANTIPLLGDMCDEEKKAPVKNNPNTVENYFSINYLLDYFSGISHILSYLVLSISLLYHLRSRKNKYWVTFIAIFIGGGLLELVQEFFIEGRHASIEDQNSNCLGALIAILLFWGFSKTKLSKRILGNS